MMKHIRIPWLWVIIFVFICLVLYLRFWRITANEFVFYDEGMYLGQDRVLLNLIESHPAQNLGELIAICGVLFKSALSTAKAFWFFILNTRVFSLGTDAWFFARLISAVSGCLTLGLVFIFARRYFDNSRIGFLSVAILAVLPSHIFYSRLGMQESLSTLLFLSGIYCYVFAKGFFWRFLSAAFLLALTFFCNYRMIIAPVFLIVIELYDVLFLKKRFDVKRILITLVAFVTLVWVVGSLYDGANRAITFGWMGHQASDAAGKFDVLKFFAFPINTFILEGFFIAFFFWYGLWQIRLGLSNRLLPFVLVLTQMAIFSLAADQGARYLCVVLPFFAISCAQAIDALLASKNLVKRRICCIVLTLSMLTMFFQSLVLVINRTHYGQAVDLIRSLDPTAKIISTQPLVTQLYVSNAQDIKECPKDINGLMKLIEQNYLYLIIDPQVHVSWSWNDIKFNDRLVPFLQDIQSTQPLITLKHFNFFVLMRFVLDHNEHVRDSIRFIAQQTSTGDIEIYDLRQSLKDLSS